MRAIYVKRLDVDRSDDYDLYVMVSPLLLPFEKEVELTLAALRPYSLCV